MKQIAQGAEAIIYQDKKKIVKDRISKSYRHTDLDNKIRRQRTKAEAKIMQKISKIIHVPKILADPGAGRMIHMQFINGKKLSQHLDEFPLAKQKQIMKLIGKSVAKLHKENIIHGDLTTSNMIYAPSKKKGDRLNNKVYFIDFGLAFQNAKYEDKGVDIHLLKQALEAKHFKHWETLFAEFEKAYKSLESKEAQKVFERLISIEKRGRYRH
mgnify:CR=1 FL=1